MLEALLLEISIPIENLELPFNPMLSLQASVWEEDVNTCFWDPLKSHSSLLFEGGEELLSCHVIVLSLSFLGKRTQFP